MIQNEFVAVMSERSDEELLEILNVRRRDYQPKAIEAVEIVLNERKVQYTKLTDEEMLDIDLALQTVAEKCYVQGDWKRFLEYLIDYIVIIAITIPFADLIGFWGNLCIIFAYFFALESSFNKTIGKIVFGLKVADINGNPPTSQQVAMRTLCRFIPFDAFSFVMGGWENHKLKSNWHDRFSNTYVVEISKLDEVKNS